MTLCDRSLPQCRRTFRSRRSTALKAILFASARPAAATGAALAGKSSHDAFAQTLPGPLRTDMVGRGAAPACSDMPIPVYARLSPSSANMAGRETSNSLPAASVARGITQGQNSQGGAQPGSGTRGPVAVLAAPRSWPGEFSTAVRCRKCNDTPRCVARAGTTRSQVLGRP